MIGHIQYWALSFHFECLDMGIVGAEKGTAC